MSRRPQFEEVVIVNPHDPRSGEGATLMRLNDVGAQTMGYYAEDPNVAGYAQADPFGEDPYGEDPYGEEPYGEYAEDQYGEEPYGEEPYGEEPYGAYAEDPYGDYAEDPYGEDPYGEDPYGAFAEDPYGWYGQTPYEGFAGYGGYAEPVGYYAEDFPVAGYGYDGWGYSEMPEMVGYGEDPYGYAGFGRYVQARRPPWNPGCPVPTNVAGFAGWDGYAEDPYGFAGYVKPSGVSPACGQVTPSPDPGGNVPDTFRALW
jgi:hypothetical protein